MASRRLLRSLAKIAVSVLFAGVFYSLCLAAFLITRAWRTWAVRAAFWVLAPAITAVGYAVGVALLERDGGPWPRRLGRIALWPLVGCGVGAGAVYWFGPMLIVFGMFAAGTASIALREALDLLGPRSSEGPRGG